MNEVEIEKIIDNHIYPKRGDSDKFFLTGSDKKRLVQALVGMENWCFKYQCKCENKEDKSECPALIGKCGGVSNLDMFPIISAVINKHFLKDNETGWVRFYGNPDMFIADLVLALPTPTFSGEEKIGTITKEIFEEHFREESEEEKLIRTYNEAVAKGQANIYQPPTEQKER